MEYLILSKNVVINVGHSRSLVICFDQENHWYISTDWGRILNQENGVDISRIPTKLPEHSAESIASFIRYLITEKIAYLSSTNQKKRPLSSSRKRHASPLLSLGIELNSPPLTLRDTITALKIDRFDLYLKEKIDLPAYLKKYSSVPLKEITIHIDFSLLADIDLDAVTNEYRLTEIIIVNAPENRTEMHKNTRVIYCDMDKSLRSFNIKKARQTIGQKRHRYFDHHAHICINGDVKNGYATKSVFGNIHSEPLAKIVAKNEFQILWGATKTNTDICSDCEFSLICFDQRPLIQRGNKSWFSLVECTYNPYICLNEDDNGYLSLAECGVFSKKQGFKIEIDFFIEAIQKIRGEENTLN